VGPGEQYAPLAELLDAAANKLEGTGARDEALGAFQRRRGLLGLGGGLRLVPHGRVWRLGVLLLDRERRLYAAGAVTRAVDPRHPNYQSVSGEERREVRRIALESGFPPGEVVNYDAELLALDEESLHRGSGPLELVDERLLVHWAPGQRAVDLAGYLEERGRLLGMRDGWDA
jgi:hypothetical protein